MGGTNVLQKGGFDAVDEALEESVVLVMLFRDDHFANMPWRDSTYPTAFTTLPTLVEIVVFGLMELQLQG